MMFQCDICHKEYSAPEAMRRHRKIHLSGRQFACAWCKATFARQDVYHRHVQQIHGWNRTNVDHVQHQQRESGASSTCSTSPLAAVTDSEPRQRKRSRVACDLCWKKKGRCDVGDPSSNKACKTCVQQGVDCCYSRRSNKIKVAIQQSDESVAQDHESNGKSRAGSSTAQTCLSTSSSCTDGRGSSSSTSSTRTSPQPLDLLPQSINITKPNNTIEATSMDVESLVGGFSETSADVTAASQIPEPTMMLDPHHHNDLMQSWDWLMDEFIPSSPMMMAHRSTPWRWRSPDCADARQVSAQHYDADVLSFGLSTEQRPHSVVMTEAAPAGSVSNSGLQVAPVTQINQAAMVAPGLESLADISLGLSNNDLVLAENAQPKETIVSANNLSVNIPQLGAHTIANAYRDDQICIYDLVHDCLNPRQTLSTDALMRKHSAALVSRLRLGSTSTALEASEHVLQFYTRLYFERFHPLWPIFPVPLLDLQHCAPHLYLTLAIIGSQYGDQHDADFGQKAHQVFRTVLIGRELDMNEVVESGETLCLTMLLNIATALYFGQRRSFYFAQQLKAILILHAQRLSLFDELRHDQRSQRILYTPRMAPPPSVAAHSNACYPDMARSEVQRRLVYGILRLDTYISLMLGQRPQIHVEDIRIAMLGDPYWWQGTSTRADDAVGSAHWDHIASDNSEHNGTDSNPSSSIGVVHSKDLDVFGVKTPGIGHDRVFASVFRRFYYGIGQNSVACRVIDQELLLFGMVNKVLTMSRQRFCLKPFVGSITELDEKRKEAPDTFLKTMKGQFSLDEDLDPYALSASAPSSSHSFDHAMAQDWSDTLDCISRWRDRFTGMQRHCDQLSTRDRQCLFHSNVLYCCVTLHLFADIEELRSLSVLRQPHRQQPLYVRAASWSRSRDAKTAVQRALNTLETIVEELSFGHNSHFTFLTYVAIYHSAIILWVAMQLVETDRCYGRIFTILSNVADPTSPTEMETDRSKKVSSSMMRIGDLYLKFNSLWPLVGNFRELVRDLAQRSLLTESV